MPANNLELLNIGRSVVRQQRMAIKILLFNSCTQLRHSWLNAPHSLTVALLAEVAQGPGSAQEQDKLSLGRLQGNQEGPARLRKQLTGWGLPRY